MAAPGVQRLPAVGGRDLFSQVGQGVRQDEVIATDRRGRRVARFRKADHVPREGTGQQRAEGVAEDAAKQLAA